MSRTPVVSESVVSERAVLTLLRAWRPAGAATVIVTHSAGVAAHADRIVHLVDGRVR